MSDLQKTVEIIFMGKDQVSSPINDITTKIDKVSASVELAAAPFGALADGILKVDAALVAMAGAGLVYAFNKSVTLQSAMIDLKKVIGDQPEVLDAAKKKALELSDTFGESSSDIIQSMAGFSQAGYSVDEAMGLVKSALDLVIVGDVDAAKSSEILISALKGFDAPASEAARLIDVLNEVSNNYATDIEQLALGMAGIAPIAKIMGFSFEETAGVLTPVIEIFRSGDEAAVALKTGLLKLIDDSKPVADALAAIGVSQKTATGELRSGKDILYDVAKAFETADKDQKLFLTAQLVGLEQSAKMVTVFDNLSKSTAITSTAMGSAGSAAKEVAARMEASEFQVNRMVTAFNNLSTAVGDKYIASMTKAISGVTDVENALKKLVDSGTFDPILNVISSFGDDASELLKKIAGNLPEAFEQIDFKGIVSAMEALGESIGVMFDDVDLTTPDGLSKAIQSIIDTGESLILATAGIVKSFEPMKNTIVGLIASFNSMSEAEKIAAGDLLGMAKQITDFGLKTVASIIFISDSADKIGPTIGIIVNTISGFADGISLFFSTAKLLMIEAVDDMLAATELFDKFIPFSPFTDDIALARQALTMWKNDVKKDMGEAADSGIKNLTGLSTNFAGLGDSADESKKKVAAVSGGIDAIPNEKELHIMTDTELAEATLEEFFYDIDAYDKNLDIVAKMSPDAKSIASTKETLSVVVTDPVTGMDNVITIEVPVESSGVDQAKKDIEAIPTEKMLEIKLQGDIDKEIETIKANAETVQTSMEWTAKVDIAGIEGRAQEITSAFEASASAIDSMSSSVGDMFSAYISGIDSLSGSDKWHMEDMLEDQQEAQNKLIDSQIKLTDAQAEYYTQRSESMASGEGIIKIDGTGLTPALGLVWEEIMEYMQERVVADEAAAQLLGL